MTAASRVRVPLPGESAYDVVIGAGLLAGCGEVLRRVIPAAKLGLVTDATVNGLYGDLVRGSLRDAGFVVHDVILEPGETSKSWQDAGATLERLAGAGLDRRDGVVALGGGVVGDLAGFVAATYMRGIDLVQLPTTLLAQVDSSVGGKTGVDLAAGKNLAGAFKQPRIVLADTDTLRTLPSPEWQSGLAEVAKAAVLEGEDFFGWIEVHAALLAQRADASILAEAVRRAVAFKAAVVVADERERDTRECLNLGHTLGHAIEVTAGYGAVPHGIAVAEGMRFAAGLAVEVAGMSSALAARQTALLDALGIPRVSGNFERSKLREAMSSDKKARGGVPRFVLLTSPGTWLATAVPEEVLGRHLEAFVSETKAGRPR